MEFGSPFRELFFLLVVYGTQGKVFIDRGLKGGYSFAHRMR